MKMKKVELELPVSIYYLLQEIADVSGRSFQDVMMMTVRSGLPPSLAKVPEAFHEELLALNKLDDKALLLVAEEDLPTTSKHPPDFSLLRQTYALRLLKWRGHPVPSPYAGLVKK